ncbi:MAG: restriction endonuclease subunit S [Capnocytophaga sp.]|nr:restriction endonuclease subunit S [Capnocytophaga sp.]MBB1545903.1 restriction endonuclease subunit S [Capnocytophaga sp.]MBB1568949.1 restriction endonuclease subunit S [Capnocytophaga sp.]
MTQEPKIFPYIARLLQGAEVVWKPLGEVAELKRGQRVTKQELSNDKQYPVYSGGVKPMGYYDAYNQEANTITIVKYGTAGYVNFITERFWANDVCYCIKPHSILENKYLLYVLKNMQVYINSLATDAIPAHLPAPSLASIQIPLPPLSVQQEIVRILDKFIQLEAELEAELDCRKRQYEYYRNKLLSYEGNEVEWKMLGEVGEIRMCKRILKEQTSDYGEVPFYKIGTFGKEADAYISKELFNEYRAKYNYPNVGDILISASGTIGRTVIFDGKEAYFQDSNIVWIENDQKKVLNKYLFYCYQIAKWNISEGGTILRLYNENLRKTLIPIPYPNNPKKSLEEQNRIVAILDKFDTLVNSISEGLPKEIALRKKQYEYYREQLLTFTNDK